MGPNAAGADRHAENGATLPSASSTGVGGARDPVPSAWLGPAGSTCSHGERRLHTRLLRLTRSARAGGFGASMAELHLNLPLRTPNTDLARTLLQVKLERQSSVARSPRSPRTPWRMPDGGSGEYATGLKIGGGTEGPRIVFLPSNNVDTAGATAGLGLLQSPRSFGLGTTPAGVELLVEEGTQYESPRYVRCPDGHASRSGCPLRYRGSQV